MARVVFLREFKEFFGGHLKVWQYFQHFLDLGHDPVVQFTADSLLDDSNPWHTCDPRRIIPPGEVPEGDLYFLGGKDWIRLGDRQDDPPAPAINLVQHVRHASPSHAMRRFLRYPAVRICVSQEVEDAICATGAVNGPTFTIPNGTDLVASRMQDGDRALDVLVVALKRPELGRWVGRLVRRPGRRVRVLDARLPRHEFTDLLGDARVTAFLPDETEGFYLPALEGMARGTIVVCPDCVGNRSFCRADDTAFVPRTNTVAVAWAVERALRQDSQQQARMLEAGWNEVDEHSLEHEREALGVVLETMGYAAVSP